MSYAKFGEFGSDVYVYLGDDLHCSGCALNGTEYTTTDRKQMIGHLGLHVEAGHCVPQRTFDRLKRELESGEVENIFEGIDLVDLATSLLKTDDDGNPITRAKGK